jgi:hypothetical protein
LHDAGLFAELAPYFLDNGARRATAAVIAIPPKR